MKKIKLNKKGKIITYSFLGIGIISLASLSFVLTKKSNNNQKDGKSTTSQLIENIKTTGLGIKKVSSGNDADNNPFSEYNFEVKPSNSLNKNIKVHSLVWNQIRNEKNEIRDENGNLWDYWNAIITNEEKMDYDESPSSYIDIAIDNENSKFKITCKKDFGFQIKLLLVSEEVDTVTAEILLDYEEKFLGYPKLEHGIPISKTINVMTIDENTNEHFKLSNHKLTDVEKGIYLIQYNDTFRQATKDYFKLRPNTYSYGSVKLNDKGFKASFSTDTTNFSCTTQYYNYQIHSVNYSNSFFLRTNFGIDSAFAKLITTNDTSVLNSITFNKTTVIDAFNNLFKTLDSTNQIAFFKMYDETIPFNVRYSFKLKEVNTNEESPSNLTFSFVFNISKKYLTTNFVNSINVETKKIIF